jgi:2-polyprenyl-6-methoxyphenol hydroxylase-like FAD-dependent oxidoreductase
VATYPIRGDKVASFFVWSDVHQPADDLGAAATLRQVYGDLGWRTPELLGRLPDDADIYYDTVAQVVLDRWHRDATVLVGDACQAVSLLAGQGASMAMGGAWALAKALREEADVPAGLRAYEALVQPAIETKQAAGRKMAAWFVPASRPRIWLRDVALSLSTKPGMGWLMRSVVSGDSIVT